MALREASSSSSSNCKDIGDLSTGSIREQLEEKCQTSGNTLVNPQTKQKQFVQFMRKNSHTQEEQQIYKTIWRQSIQLSIPP